jgi:flagellar export protein FliJ
MSRRENLLRLKRFGVEELKRRLATLDAMRADVERKLADLEEAIARERQRSSDSDLGRLAFPSFMRAMDSRRENLTATLGETDRERDRARSDLTSAWQELKALESAAEQEAKRAAETEMRRGEMRLGELALARQLRRQALRQA